MENEKVSCGFRNEVNEAVKKLLEKYKDEKVAILCFSAELVGEDVCNSSSAIAGKSILLRATLNAAMKSDADLRRLVIGEVFNIIAGSVHKAIKEDE